MIDKLNSAFVLLLSGRGERLYPTIKMKKQFYPLGGKEMYLYPLEVVSSSSIFSEIVLVVDEEDIDHVKRETMNLKNSVDLIYAIGGSSRNDSVRAGLEALRDVRPDIVLIHDADRPFLTIDVLSDVIARLRVVEAVTCYVPLSDSLFDSSREIYIPRDDKKLIYTPQGFIYPKILEIYESSFDPESTDDFSKAVGASMSHDLVRVSPLLFKVTDAQTLSLAELIVDSLKSSH